MELDELYKLSKKLKDDNDIGTNVELILLRKATNGEIINFSLDADNKLQSDLLEIFINNFKRSEKRNYTQKEYDVVTSGKFDKEYYKTTSKKYAGVKNFIDSFKDDLLDDITGLNEKSFFAYAVKVHLGDQYFIFIAPFSEVSRISATKIMGNLKNNKITKLDSTNTVGFSSSISIIIKSNELLILNNLRIFEKCCGMKTEFQEKAKHLLSKIAEFDTIDDFDELVKSIESDSVIAKRLTKMNQNYLRVESFFNNKKEIQKVLNDEAFKEKFKDIKFIDNKLKFEKKNRHAFITLISDACYETIVGKTKGIDEGY
ncbi:Kiwa anti-phage protein KwaB-like domain-containing protein [Enterococcus alishanensis]